MKTLLIVEDEIHIQNGLEKILLSIDQNLNIVKTAYACEALEFAKNNLVHAFMLDIQLLDYNGIELGKQIRELDNYKFTPIIFITAVPTKEIIAFKQLHSYDYIIKPFTVEEVRNTMETVINHYTTSIQKEMKVLKLKQKEITYNFRQEDILYIEKRNRKLIITTLNEVATFTMYTLNQIEEELDNNFLRCHKGFIVNTDQIEKIDKKNSIIYLRNRVNSIPIGRKYMENLKAANL